MTSKGGKMTSKSENNDNNNRNKSEPESKGIDHDPPTKGQRATTKGEQRRGRGPISDSQADGRLKQLKAFVQNVTCKRAERPNARKNGAWETPTPKSAGVKLVEFVKENCGVEEVFRCTRGTLPPCTSGNLSPLKAMFEECEKPFDYGATMMLNDEVRDVWVAMFVEGDGNCFWRAVAKAIWGKDCFWTQLKLVVLGWTAANAEALVAEDGPLFKDPRFYTPDIMARHVFTDACGVTREDKYNYHFMLLDTIAQCSPSRKWAGDITALMLAQALGITVKQLAPTDQQSRQKYDAENREPPRGRGRHGLDYDDYRHSLTFVPEKNRASAWCVRGEEGRVIEEVTIALTNHCHRVNSSALASIPKVTKDTDCDNLCHFAAIMTKDGSTPPFRVVDVAPPLFPVHDELLKKRADMEYTAYLSRQGSRVAARAHQHREGMGAASTKVAAEVSGAGEVPGAAEREAAATAKRQREEREAAEAKAAAAEAAEREAAATAKRQREQREAAEAKAAAAEAAEREAAATAKRQREQREAAEAKAAAAEAAGREAAATAKRQREQREAAEAKAAAAETAEREAAALAKRKREQGQAAEAKAAAYELQLQKALDEFEDEEEQEGEKEPIAGGDSSGPQQRIEAIRHEVDIREKKMKESKLSAAKAKAEYKRRKEANEDALQERKEQLSSLEEWTPELVLTTKPLYPLRVEAAVARRRFDKKCRAYRRARRRLDKILEEFHGQKMEVDGDDSDVSDSNESDASGYDSGSTNGWCSDDSLPSHDALGAEKDRDEQEASAARQKQESHVASCRATAKEAKMQYNRQKKITDAADDQALREDGTAADDHAATGANEELKKRRAAAAIAWWEYEKAEKRLEKMLHTAGGGGYSDDSGDEGTDYRSDAIYGWESENDLSCDEREEADSRTNESDKTHGPGLLDFEYAADEDNVRPAPVFSVLPDPDDTWANVWKDVRTALAQRGHIGKMNVKKDERLDGASSRWQRQKLVCCNFGKSTATPKNANKDKQRKRASTKCECTFMVKVAWNDDQLPTMKKVCLSHVKECKAVPSTSDKRNLVDPETIQKDFSDDIRLWTMSALPPLSMYRLIEKRVKPLELGENGRQKVRNMVTKVQREMWSTPTDALDLVSTLKAMPGCVVKWETDALHRLKAVIWSTAEQRVAARQFGHVVIQDNTCLTNRYDMKLMLFIGVDSENKTIVFAQGFFSDEQTASFLWALEHYVEICGGRHPEVIITDADCAMTSAVASYLPRTKHLHCLWHIMKNARKNCQGALKDKAKRFFRLLHAAAFAVSENDCEGVWKQIKELAQGSSCEKHVKGYMYEHRKYWSRCYHPTSLTLNMTASQRVEGIFAVLKRGRIVNRRATLVWVKEELERRIAGFRLASRLLSSKETDLGRTRVDDHVLDTVQPVLDKLREVGASNYALDETVAEMRAGAAYDTEIMKEGDGCQQFLSEMTTRGGDFIDVCAQVPEDAFSKTDSPDTSMYGTASLLSFSELVRGVPLDGIVRVTYKYSKKKKQNNKKKKVSHIVVVGPGGFVLCSCLQLLRCGLHCCHSLAALATSLDRADDFVGDSIHPRWRRSGGVWSVHSAKLTDFDGHERGVYRGATDDLEGMDSGCVDDVDGGTINSSISVIRGKIYADFMARAAKWAAAMSENYDGSQQSYKGTQEFLDRSDRDVKAYVTNSPSDNGGLGGMGNPPVHQYKTRKESRHKDWSEAPPKKAKKAKAVHSVDVVG